MIVGIVWYGRVCHLWRGKKEVTVGGERGRSREAKRKRTGEGKVSWGRMVMRETCEIVCEIDLFYDLWTGPSTGW